MVLSIPAVLLIVSEGRLPTDMALWSGSALGMGCLVGVLLGLQSLVFGRISPDAGAMPAFLTQLGAAALIPLIAGPIQTWAPGSRDARRFDSDRPRPSGATDRPLAPMSPEVRRFGLLVGLIDIGAVIALVIAFQRGNVAVVAAMLGFAPATTMTLAWKIYHEAVRRWQWVGAAMGAVAIVLFSTAA